MGEKLGGWIKGLLAAVFGLASGAAVMYFSPWIDQVVKPAKPIANFEVQTNGLSVTFVNKSMGNGKGRWDYGDGSPLEFVKADQPSVTHAYRKSGTYQVKYALTNALGEESERSVAIEVGEESEQAAAKPRMLDLHAQPPGRPGQPICAPATFQFEAAADDTEFYIWDFGDGQGIQKGKHQAGHTFERPGSYRITVYAFNGEKQSQMDTTIEVVAAPLGSLNIHLKVADQGTQVDSKQREATASRAMTITGKSDSSTVEQMLSASAGFDIVSVERKKSQSENVGNVQFQIAPDKKSVKVTGQVGKLKAGTTVVLNELVTVKEQKRLKATREPVPVASTLSAPGATTLLLPPVPDNWVDVQRQYSFELKLDNRVLWQGPRLPDNVDVSFGGRTYTLIASPKGDRLQISLATKLAAN